MDNFRTEVDKHGNIKVTSYVEAVVLSKEEQEQALRIFKQLQEENAKLRERVDAAHMSRLLTENENEKLRELLRKLGHFEKLGCHKCPYEGRCAKSIYDVDCSMRLEIEKEMCELGIEVPE